MACLQHAQIETLYGSSNSSSSPLEGGGDHRGGVGVIGGRDSPWDKRVGFEAPVSGGSTPLLLPHTRFAQVKGEAPAYCLSLCRRPSGHGMYSYACSGSGSSANGVMYCWMVGLHSKLAHCVTQLVTQFPITRVLLA